MFANLANVSTSLHRTEPLPGDRPVADFEQVLSDLETGISNAAKAWTHLAPYFIAVQGDMNSGTMDPTALYDVQQSLASDTDYVVVRTDHFFELMREANGLTIDP